MVFASWRETGEVEKARMRTHQWPWKQQHPCAVVREEEEGQIMQGNRSRGTNPGEPPQGKPRYKEKCIPVYQLSNRLNSLKRTIFPENSGDQGHRLSCLPVQ